MCLFVVYLMLFLPRLLIVFAATHITMSNNTTQEEVLLTKVRDCVLYGQIFELGSHSAGAYITLQFDEVCNESRDVWG
jgi:hypothetical protein